MRRLFYLLLLTVQVSDEYVTTGLIIVLYIFILVFFFRNFDKCFTQGLVNLGAISEFEASQG
jgi:hypothetical protein